jgi:fructose-1,6-bisphosphatase I
MARTTLSAHLRELGVDEHLASIFLDLSSASKEIYASISLLDMVKGGTQNTSGDVQSSLDVVSDNIIAGALDGNPAVCSHLNEECLEVRTCTADGTYFVAYDPYDGGSVGDANITVGSIFGIWNEAPKIGEPVGNGLVAGAYALWGPKLSFAWGTKEHGVWWYEKNAETFELIGRLDFDSKESLKGIFCPGDSPFLAKSKEYEALFRHMLDKKLRLRYTGCCVSDAHHVLHKKGVFWYPPGAKGGLRLLYEFAPLGFLFLCAGGIAIDHLGRNVLDIPVEDWHQRTSFMLSSPHVAEEASALFKNISSLS